MKKLANLKGAKALNKKEQQSINGGGIPKLKDICPSSICPPPYPDNNCDYCIEL